MPVWNEWARARTLTVEPVPCRCHRELASLPLFAGKQALHPWGSTGKPVLPGPFPPLKASGHCPTSMSHSSGRSAFPLSPCADVHIVIQVRLFHASLACMRRGIRAHRYFPIKVSQLALHPALQARRIDLPLPIYKENSMKQEPATAPDIRFIKLPEVVALCRRSKSSIYEAIKKGEFPAPVKLSYRSVAWIRSEITSWAEARVTASRRGNGGCDQSE